MLDRSHKIQWDRNKTKHEAISVSNSHKVLQITNQTRTFAIQLPVVNLPEAVRRSISFSYCQSLIKAFKFKAVLHCVRRANCIVIIWRASIKPKFRILFIYFFFVSKGNIYNIFYWLYSVAKNTDHVASDRGLHCLMRYNVLWTRR